MAPGIDHLVINLAVGTVMVAATYATAPELTAPCFVGAVAGLLITPDMDLDGSSITENILRSVPVVGFLWQWAWYGYAMLFRHRGRSHSVFFGTASRVGWSCLVYAAAVVSVSGVWCMSTGGDNHVFVTGVVDSMKWFLAYVTQPVLLLAWFVQDATHYAADSPVFKAPGNVSVEE